jgi:hypothetical protein
MLRRCVPSDEVQAATNDCESDNPAVSSRVNSEGQLAVRLQTSDMQLQLTLYFLQKRNVDSTSEPIVS